MKHVMKTSQTIDEATGLVEQEQVIEQFACVRGDVEVTLTVKFPKATGHGGTLDKVRAFGKEFERGNQMDAFDKPKKLDTVGKLREREKRSST